MWHRLMYDYNLNVKRNDVMRLIKEIDPEGVRLRKSQRLIKAQVLCKKSKFYLTCGWTTN